MSHSSPLAISFSLVVTSLAFQLNTHRQAASSLGTQDAVRQHWKAQRSLKADVPISLGAEGDPVSDESAKFYTGFFTHLAESHPSPPLRRAAFATLTTDKRLADRLTGATLIIEAFNQEAGQNMEDLDTVRDWILRQDDPSWQKLPLLEGS
ncbi:MAG: hypothetical protein AAF514_03735 [Verrucomicrobiota bacterium]